MRDKILEPFIRFLKVMMCEEYKHLRILFFIFIIYK